MSAPTAISVEEYLKTVYRPDRDYVDGEVQERHLGERDHSWIQKRLILYLGTREETWGITVYPEQRVQVKPKRFRVPDVCVVIGDTQEQILTVPPFLCIEVLSPEDRWIRVKERIQDYLEMGVPFVWILDPGTRTAFTATPAAGIREVTDGWLRTESPQLEVPLSWIFERK